MADRRQAEARGHRGETLAAWWLRLKGHRILGRRVKTHAGEIDLVTLCPFGPVCFVEVKAGAARATPPKRSRRRSGLALPVPPPYIWPPGLRSPVAAPASTLSQ